MKIEEKLKNTAYFPYHMNIRNATIKDIDEVCKLEQSVEGNNAATKETLLSRLKMFPEGFCIAKENGNVLGYVESCLWNKSDFETFDEIKDFPNNHDINAKTLYVIFIAVDEMQRKNGIGSALITTLQKYAEKKQLEKVQLVAVKRDSTKDFLIGFYNELGFRTIRELPHFLPDKPGTLMEYCITK